MQHYLEAMSTVGAGPSGGQPRRGDASVSQRLASRSPEPWGPSRDLTPSSCQHTPTERESASPTPERPNPQATSGFRSSSRAVLLTWSQLREEPTGGLVARFEAFCRNRPNHWRTLAVVERHDPNQSGFDPQ